MAPAIAGQNRDTRSPATRHSETWSQREVTRVHCFRTKSLSMHIAMRDGAISVTLSRFARGPRSPAHVSVRARRGTLAKSIRDCLLRRRTFPTTHEVSFPWCIAQHSGGPRPRAPWPGTPRNGVRRSHHPLLRPRRPFRRSGGRVRDAAGKSLEQRHRRKTAVQDLVPRCTWWAILRGQDGVAFYELHTARGRVGRSWTPS